MVQVVKTTNPKHFERVLSDMKKQGWRVDGKVKVFMFKGKQNFEAKMVHHTKRG